MTNPNREDTMSPNTTHTAIYQVTGPTLALCDPADELTCAGHEYHRLAFLARFPQHAGVRMDDGTRYEFHKLTAEPPAIATRDQLRDMKALIA